ncbi:hypothetical protein PILCRDRAFT_824607 [Piloderma croceum F 1598]|uniref:DUF4189 domain-containing protein n=1 Tax=Piloderma croceum (strain F 1598) TaxID=765440 RepID=A0A0C3FE29_PILCF|nr:hypothetical protein PILCRDRAFT_824607 [Piloderma croceum F 1598]
MKSIIFFATVALSSTSSVFGAPATTSTLLTSRVQHPRVTASNAALTRAANNWACLAFSPSTADVGPGLGSDENSAALAAIRQCAVSDCTVKTGNGGPDCVKHGCMAFTRGVPTTAGAAPIFPSHATVASASAQQETIDSIIAGSRSACIAESKPGSCGTTDFFCTDLS